MEWEWCSNSTLAKTVGEEAADTLVDRVEDIAGKVEDIAERLEDIACFEQIPLAHCSFEGSSSEL